MDIQYTGDPYNEDCNISQYDHILMFTYVFFYYCRLAFKFWVKPGFMPVAYGLGYYSANDHLVSIKDNQHGAYIYTEKVIDKSNTVYKVDFLYTETHYEVSVFVLSITVICKEIE